jgi:GAF domain-containing protein/HAMP domain-containing protein
MSDDMKSERRATSSDRNSNLVETQVDVAVLNKQRRNRIKQVLRIGLFADLIVFIFYVTFALQTGAWQMLAVAGLATLGLLGIAAAAWQLRRRNFDRAGSIILFTILISYGGSELVVSSVTLYLLLSGLLLILALARVILWRRWEIWGAALVLLGGWIWLVNRLNLLPRYDVTQLRLVPYLVFALTGLVGGYVLWQLIRDFLVRSIRNRLLVTSIVTVTLTAGAVATGSVVTGIRSGRQQVFNQLESVATLKEAEIERWLISIEDVLASSVQQSADLRYLDSEMVEVVSALIDAPKDSALYQQSYDILLGDFQRILQQEQLLETVFFMGPEGQIILSTNPDQEGQIQHQEDFFQRGKRLSYVSPPIYSPSLGQTVVVASRPVLGEYGRLLGVLAGYANMETLDTIMSERSGLGETGETYLVGANNAMITASRFDDEKSRYVRTEAVEEALANRENGSGLYLDYREVPVVGVYHWLPRLQVALVAEQDQSEALRGINRTVWTNAGIALVAAVAAGLVSLLIAQSIGRPLRSLSETASRIAAGDLDRTASVERQDEIGALAKAFNSMTTRLRELIGNLEQRVAERTRDLEVRSAYLEASAEVGRAASSILDVDELNQSVVSLIRRRFGFYYVGLFLLDETGGWARLRAGTGEAGQKMLEQKHKLKVGGESMIGQCVDQGEARIALDVGEEPVHFDNPLLPSTRSEVALPLRSRGRILGAITVQSAQPSAFDEDVVTVLQTMADYVAVALDNAYLFAEAQEALEAAQRAYGELSRESWAELLRIQPDLGYHSDERGVVKVSDTWRPAMEEAVRTGQPAHGEGVDSIGNNRPLSVPIKVRGQVVGVLDTYKPGEADPWTQEEISTLEAVANQLGVTLEGARLYRETQRRAARERLVGEIAGQMRGSMDPDAILKTTVQELGRALKAEVVSVEMTGPEGNGIETAEEESSSEDMPDGNADNTSDTDDYIEDKDGNDTAIT